MAFQSMQDRLAFMDALSNEDESEEEKKGLNKKADEPSDEPSDEELDENLPAESEHENEEQDPPAEEPKKPAAERVKVKVNGQEEEVDLATLVAQYQKEKSGDQRLTQAAIRERELIERERALLEQERKVLDMQRDTVLRLEATANKHSEAAKGPSEADVLKQIEDAKLEGEFEKASALFDQVIQQRVNAALSAREESLTTQISQKAKEEAQKAALITQRASQFDVAIKQALKANPEINSDPDLQALFDMKLEARAAKGGDPFDCVEEVSREISGFVAKFKPAEPHAKVDAELLAKREADAAKAQKSAPPSKTASARADFMSRKTEEKESVADVVRGRVSAIQAIREKALREQMGIRDK